MQQTTSAQVRHCQPWPTPHLQNVSACFHSLLKLRLVQAFFRTHVGFECTARFCQRWHISTLLASLPTTTTARCPPSADPTSYGILESFYYGRALAVTLNRWVGEAVVEVVSEISKQAAEQPQRLKDFQAEVEAAVRQEMAAGGAPAAPTAAPAGQSGSAAAGRLGKGAAGGKKAAPPPPVDVQATVDEVRADIAASRSLIQQIKASRNGTSA